jgi:glycosyltransferase involved in cell wall biosynthesis
MRIAILGSRGYPSTYGGFETFVRHLSPWLRERGHDVTVYCRSKPDHGAGVWETGGVRCVWTPGLDSKSWSTVTFGATGSVDAAARGYDAILVLNVANGLFMPALWSRGTPVALNVDGIEWQRGKWGGAARFAFRLGAWMSTRLADELIVDAEALRPVWRDMYGVATTYIPYGAPVVRERNAHLVTTLGLDPERYVLVVARLAPENNVDLALDAAAMLAEQRTTVVVGTANYDSPLQQRVQALDRAGSVRWLGHVDDQELLTALWANCGAYVHGHSVGGTNPALLQALGAGAPTLALDTPFNREVVGDGDQLFPASAPELARRIDACLTSADRRQRFRMHGQRVVAERYDWEMVCERYMQVLERLAEGRARGATRPSPVRRRRRATSLTA